MRFWPRRKTLPEVQPAPDMPRMINLSATDPMRMRIEKAFAYAGFPNPNRLGTVDAFYFVFSEYERLDRNAAYLGQSNEA